MCGRISLVWNLESIITASAETTFNLCIENAPPSLVLKWPFCASRYVAQRQLHVILHSIVELTRCDTVQFQLTWANLMDIWRNSATQLQMDGVPLEQIMNGGVLCVVTAITKLQRGHVVDFPHGYQKLEEWRYDPASDSNTINPYDAGHPESRLFTENHGTFVTNESDETPGNDEYSDVAYPWPDDAKRYKALALPIGYDEPSSASEQPSMVIQLRPRNPMGQNRVTTLHYLTRIMKNVSQDILEGPLQLNFTDFWTTVWFHMPETKWRIHSAEETMERFEWVFHFAREGTMPIEAQRVKEALRLLAKSPVARKWGAMLASSQHPYNQPSDCTITLGLIGPDLCPEWFNDIITSRAASELSSILFRLHGLRLSRHQIQQKYGILIAYLYEEERPNGCGVSQNSTSQSLHLDSGCQGFAGSGDNLTHGRETSDELLSLKPACFEIATSLEDKALGSSCICRNNKEGSMLHCSACSQWFHVECVNMAESLAALVKTYFCLACTSETQQTTFIRHRGPLRKNARTCEQATATEADSAFTAIPQLDDASGVQPCQQLELRPSTAVQPVAKPHMHSRILRSQSRRAQIAAEPEASTNSSKISVIRRGVKRKRMPDARIDQDLGLAVTASHSNTRVSRSASRREAATDTSQRADMPENSDWRRAKGSARESGDANSKSWWLWSPEEEEWLLNYKQRHPESSLAESVSAFNKTFKARTRNSIQRRLIKLGLGPGHRRPWSPEEEEWLLNYNQRHPKTSFAETTSAFNRAFATRTEGSISGFLRSRCVSTRRIPWSTEENEWILDFVRRQPDSHVTRDVVNEFNRNFKPRSTASLRSQITILGRNLGRKSTYRYWSPEKDKWLMENCSLNRTSRIPSECLRAFEVEFGHSVTRHWMYERLDKLGREPRLRNAPEELIDWLRSELASGATTGTVDFCRITKDLNDRFATSYSQDAVEQYERTGMKGKSTPAGSRVYVPWTQDQREWLTATIDRGGLPPLTRPQIADSFYNHFGVRRTANSFIPEIAALGGQKTWSVSALKWIVEAVGNGISWGPMVALYEARFESAVSAEQLRRLYEDIMSSEDARARLETKGWTIETVSKGRKRIFASAKTDAQ